MRQGVEFPPKMFLSLLWLYFIFIHENTIVNTTVTTGILTGFWGVVRGVVSVKDVSA